MYFHGFNLVGFSVQISFLSFLDAVYISVQLFNPGLSNTRFFLVCCRRGSRDESCTSTTTEAYSTTESGGEEESERTEVKKLTVQRSYLLPENRPMGVSHLLLIGKVNVRGYLVWLLGLQLNVIGLFCWQDRTGQLLLLKRMLF